MLHRNEFTAEPWGKCAALGTEGDLLFWDVARIEDVYRGTVCSVYDAENIGGITEEECETNANLIAAAPEMYEALEEAITLVHSAGDEQEDGAAQSGPEFWHNQALLLEDILAKARGES